MNNPCTTCGKQLCICNQPILVFLKEWGFGDKSFEYFDLFTREGAQEISDLRFFNEEDFENMGFPIITRRKLIEKVLLANYTNIINTHLI